jgi:hypothetical protein
MFTAEGLNAFKKNRVDDIDGTLVILIEIIGSGFVFFSFYYLYSVIKSM